MKIILRSRGAVLAAALLLSAPAAALAQRAETAAPAAPTATAPQSIEARVEAYIEKLHQELHITPAQEAQWKRYATVMRQNARAMERAFMKRARQLSSMNAVANLKSYERLAEAHVQRLRKLVPAFQNLYAAMPAEQKKLADEVFRESAEKHAAERRPR
jgi:periplasmic protein CpxP/Spy